MSRHQGGVPEFEITSVGRHVALQCERSVSLWTAEILTKTLADDQGLRDSMPAGWRGGNNQTAAVRILKPILKVAIKPDANLFRAYYFNMAEPRSLRCPSTIFKRAVEIVATSAPSLHW